MTQSRARSLAVALLLMTAAALADNLEGPADYVAILSKSKLRYKMLAEPSKRPLEALRCGRRDYGTRLVVKGSERMLQRWDVRPEAMERLDEAEKLFQQKDYEGALAKYEAALAADPNAVAAHLFAGDALLFGRRDPAAALVQYRKAIALDPTLPTGHFFAASALSRLGRPREAHAEIVEALTYYPGYESVLKVVTRQPRSFGVGSVGSHEFTPPAGYLGTRSDDGIDVFGGTDGRWLGYATCKAAWANEPGFADKKRPGELSLVEERACVLAQVMASYDLAEARLHDLATGNDKAVGEQGEAAVIAAMPELERHILTVYRQGLLDGYILYEIMGRSCPLAVAMMEETALAQLREYVRTHVVPAQ